MSTGYFDVTSLVNLEEAEAYLTAYDQRYATASIGDAGNYLDKYMYTPTEGVDMKIRTVKFPIALTAVELRLFKGRRHFTRGGTRYIEVNKKPYQEGLKEFVHLMVDPGWTGFSMGPEKLRKIVTAWPTEQAAILINTGETIPSWKGGNFLSASVPSNPLKKSSATYRTYRAAFTLTHANVETLIAEMANRRDMENRPIGLVPGTLFCSAPLYPTALSIARDDYVNGTQISNPIKKYNLQVEMWPDLDVDRWGMLQEAALSDYPLFHFVKGPDEMEVFDRTSYLYQSKKMMGVSVDVDLGIALARNEAIVVCKTT